MAEFLTYLARLDINLATISLNEANDLSGDTFEISVEIAENIDVNEIKEKIKDRYKIIDFVSQSDPYHN